MPERTFSLHEGEYRWLTYLLKASKVTAEVVLKDGHPMVVIRYPKGALDDYRPTQEEYERVFGKSDLWKDFYPFRER